jgi:hypothetical protein
MVVDRKTARENLRKAIYIATHGIVKEVYDAPVEDWGSLSPVVFVAPAGDEPTRLTSRGGKFVYDFEIHTFVAYNSSITTSSDSLDVLDAIAKALCDMIIGNIETSDWKRLEQNGKSMVIGEVVGGDAYYHEIRPVSMTVT